MRFSGLRFGVRGALVQLNGYYVLRGGALDFRGSVRLDARASQTMTGWKSVLAKAVDPLLAKDGAGTVLPIKITGTAKQPKFGVEDEEDILRSAGCRGCQVLGAGAGCQCWVLRAGGHQ